MGMLALLHGASSSEVRMLQITDVDSVAQTVKLGKRPHPVPLDPASWTVVQRCLSHREAWPTANPHVMVTKGTKVGRSPASTAYLSHVLDDCGYPPRTIRSTRLLDLVNTMDPKLVAAAFGMDPQATLIHLAAASIPDDCRPCRKPLAQHHTEREDQQPVSSTQRRGTGMVGRVEVQQVNEESLEELLAVAVEGATPEEVMPPVVGPPGWTTERQEALRNWHRARRPGLAGPLRESTFAITHNGRIVGSARLALRDS